MALTMSHGSCGAVSSASSDTSRFIGMLLSLFAFAFRLAVNPEVFFSEPLPSVKEI